MKLIFLDIDGVLNDHVRHPNGVCGLKANCVTEFNRILAAVPDAMIVVSSAWRYYVHNDYMTAEGFEMMLQSHGVACYQRIHGFTEPDPETFHPSEHLPPYDEQLWRDRGIRWRVEQIVKYWLDADQPQSVAVDDLPLATQYLVQTNKDTGLTPDLADEIIRRLQ